jgi:hypothetical protein
MRTNDTVIVDVEGELSCASALTALAGWIERARFLTEGVEAICERDKNLEERDTLTLQERLEANSIAYGDAYWTEAESAGLHYLHGIVEQRIEAAKEAVLSSKRSAQT